MFTAKDKALLESDTFDPRKLLVSCKKHMYFGPSDENPHIKTELGCEQCMAVYFLHDLVHVAPADRMQRLEEIYEVVRNLVQAREGNKWDYKPFRYAKVETELDAWPDKPGPKPLIL